MQSRILLELPEERPEITFEILHAHAEEDRLPGGGTRIVEFAAVLPVLRVKPAPAFSSVEADRRAVRADFVVADEAEMPVPRFRKHGLEAPVKPVSRGVPQFHIQLDIAPVHGNDFDVSARNPVCDHDFSLSFSI